MHKAQDSISTILKKQKNKRKNLGIFSQYSQCVKYILKSTYKYCLNFYHFPFSYSSIFHYLFICTLKWNPACSALVSQVLCVDCPPSSNPGQGSPLCSLAPISNGQGTLLSSLFSSLSLYKTNFCQILRSKRLYFFSQCLFQAHLITIPRLENPLVDLRIFFLW